MARHHFKAISEQHQFFGIPAPEHPHFSIFSLTSKVTEDVPCPTEGLVLSSSFYSISFKKITAGEIFYGRTKYDCQSGTMLFMAPDQEVRTQGVKVESTGRAINFHEDFLRGHSIKDILKSYRFFGYATNEALHLSPKEEQIISGLFDNIEHEYLDNHDQFSRELILSHLETLLKYADRFYHRQFLYRKEKASSLLEKFQEEMQSYFRDTPIEARTTPNVETLAQKLKMTPRYLSDALKVETGKTAIENIHLFLIDRAKDRLLDANLSIAQVSQELGFEYPQYFARLFKKKVGMTPTSYRTSLN